MANVTLWCDSLLRIKFSKLNYKAFQKIASKDSGRFFYDSYDLLLKL